MRGHADAEALAAFREELLSRRKAGRVSAHLAACPRCAALDAQLAEVTTMLTRSTAPPMPDALTARIEAALAAEAATRSGAALIPADAAPADASPADAVPAGAVPAAAGAGQGAAAPGAGERNGARGAAGGHRASRPGPGRSWLALRVAAVTAAVAVIAGGGYGVAQLLSSGSPASTGASSGAAGAPAPNGKRTAPRMSTGGIQPGSGTNVPGAPGASPRVISSGTNYQPGRLGAQAIAVLAALGTNAHPSAQPVQFPGLQFCLDHVTHGQHPLLVDVASYQGHPAVIIVLPATHPRVLVVAPGCTATTAQVLATTTLPG